MQPVTEVTMVDLPCDVMQGQEKAVRPLDQAGGQSIQTWYALGEVSCCAGLYKSAIQG